MHVFRHVSLIFSDLAYQQFQMQTTVRHKDVTVSTTVSGDRVKEFMSSTVKLNLYFYTLQKKRLKV